MSFTRFISSLTKAVSLRNSRNLQRLWVFRNLRNEAPWQLPQAPGTGPPVPDSADHVPRTDRRLGVIPSGFR
jgi:hypothetical protein